MDIFKGLFDSSTTTVISVTDFLICMGVSLILGLIIAVCAKLRTRYSNSFIVTLGLLPAIVCVVIMMVNGNIGAGVAIAGAFALVRFRSMPGDAKQIALVFLTMATGLITGMGYLAYAALFTVLMCFILIIYTVFVDKKTDIRDKTLKIVIPEDLDYTNVFDPILKKYNKDYKLVKVATSNMGSLYKLTYNILLKEVTDEKKMIDELRCRNGNLEISLHDRECSTSEL